MSRFFLYWFFVSHYDTHTRAYISIHYPSPITTHYYRPLTRTAIHALYINLCFLNIILLINSDGIVT